MTFYTSKFSCINNYDIIGIAVVMYYMLMSFKYGVWTPWRWWSSAEACGVKQRNVFFCILFVHMLVLYMNNSNHIYFFFMESYCLFFKQSKPQTPQTLSAHCCITLC